MKKAGFLFFLLLSLNNIFAQHTIDSLKNGSKTDSAFNKYAHYGLTFGSGMVYCNFDNLRSQGYMLGHPDNVNFLPVGSSVYIGNVHKFFGSFEYAFGMKNYTGTFTDGLNTFNNMEVSIMNLRYGFNLYRNFYFSKHFAFDADIGSSFANDFISSTNNYNAGSKQIFANGKIKQTSIYAGTMFRLFWSTRSADVGFNLKIGYAIPVTKATWHSSIPTIQNPPQVDLSGFLVSLSFYTWSYNRDYIIKHMKYNPYMYYPNPYARQDTTPAPTDSTKSLFKKTKYSYIQWDLGYSALNLKGEWKNGFDISFIGAVFNKKYFTSLGFLGFVQNTPYTAKTPPAKVDNYVGIYWNNEFLVKPDNLINFSFPVKISYVGATGWDTIFQIGNTPQSISNWNFTGKNYYQHYGEFVTVAPGANAFINIFKPLSLGVGVNYRFSFNVPKEMGTNADFSNLSVLAFLRIKFDTKAVNKRMMENQKAYWDAQQKK